MGARRQVPHSPHNFSRELFDSLDRCEAILEKQDFIAGDQLTEADIRLFMTLIRFDEVYVVYFKTNKKFIHEYPRLKVGVGECKAYLCVHTLSCAGVCAEAVPHPRD